MIRSRSKRACRKSKTGSASATTIFAQQLEAAKNEPKFQPVVIKPAASEADIAFVESHRADLPVLELMMVQRRRYPHGEMARQRHRLRR